MSLFLTGRLFQELGACKLHQHFAPLSRMSLLFLEFVLIPKGTKQLECGGLRAGEAHTKRVPGNAAPDRGHDLCWDGRSSLPSPPGWALIPSY